MPGLPSPADRPGGGRERLSRSAVSRSMFPSTVRLAPALKLETVARAAADGRERAPARRPIEEQKHGHIGIRAGPPPPGGSPPGPTLIIGSCVKGGSADAR